MKKLIIYISFSFLIIINYSCNTHNNSNSQWEIIFCNQTNPFLENATIIEFNDDSIRFINTQNFNTFKYVLSNDKLLIKSNQDSWLMKVDSLSSDKLLFTEIYSGNPLKIEIKNIVKTKN